ncbi:Predicted Fe-Mo cluster-binding protein, NifX family [Sporobacter termitidis DSM 10068]|uniref:Predicted Fe-Mo cluster-binding protein, NifX family n=1 Tax=Sporobacter termitidis DSM 10068 TaxID=1123282 RepID=A0A1M5ZD14_9FIRM|nr:NifB/NifX family molybdenum-iron cluster-binding protein [Sporobacter termitidis]SHI22115.1 Predicted Fe-Mo cluster-binding protein, NifX family [Sporobacter termitidis DSM 10068]
MKIAVPTENDQIFQHFGQSHFFTVYTADGGNITGKTFLDAGENGHSALAGLLSRLKIDVLICGGIGGGAKAMLASENIELVSGIDGSVEDAVNAYLGGRLRDTGAVCDHHEHEHTHDCSCHDHCR